MAHLIEERVVSHLGPCVELLASDDHLYHRLEVIAHELAGFKHLHLDLPGTKQDPEVGDLGSPSPTGILSERTKCWDEKHLLWIEEKPTGGRLAGAGSAHLETAWGRPWLFLSGDCHFPCFALFILCGLSFSSPLV